MGTEKVMKVILVTGIGCATPLLSVLQPRGSLLAFLQNLADPSDNPITPRAKMHVVFLMHVLLAQEDN